MTQSCFCPQGPMPPYSCAIGCTWECVSLLNMHPYVHPIVMHIGAYTIQDKFSTSNCMIRDDIRGVIQKGLGHLNFSYNSMPMKLVA